MMKRLSVVTACLGIALAFIPVRLRSQQIIWERDYTAGKGSLFNNISYDPIGGYLLFGMTDLSTGETVPSSKPWVMHIDGDGNVLWNSTFGTGHYTALTSEFVGALGASTICGYTQAANDDTVGHTDIYMAQFNAGGAPTLLKMAGLTGSNVGNGLAAVIGGGFVITGAGDSGISLLKLDGDGNRLWYKQYGGGSYRYGLNVAALADGGFLIMGQAVAGDTGGPLPIVHVMLIRTDANGDSLWTRYASDENLNVGPYQRTGDGGFLIVGATNEGKPSPYLMKLDVSGNYQWTQVFHAPFDHYGVYPSNIIHTLDDDYIATGKVIGVGSGVNYQPFIWKFAADGSTRWFVVLNDSSNALEATGVAESTDGTLMICGSRGNVENQKGFVIKVGLSALAVPHDEYPMLKLDLTDAGAVREGNE